MSKRNKRITVGTGPLPETREDVNTLIDEIAALQKSIADIETDCDENVAAIQKKAADEIKPIKNRLNERVARVHAYCVAHRENLTKGGKVKTVKFPAGACSWRMSGGKVSIKGVDDVLKRLHTLGKNFKKFIATKETIDKKAMLKDPDLAEMVEGVTIERGEIFAIKPVTTNVEEMV